MREESVSNRVIEEEQREIDILMRLTKKMRQNLSYIEDVLRVGMERRCQRRKWRMGEESFYNFYAEALREYEDDGIAAIDIEKVIYHKEEIRNITAKMNDFMREIEMTERHLESIRRINSQRLREGMPEET